MEDVPVPPLLDLLRLYRFLSSSIRLPFPPEGAGAAAGVGFGAGAGAASGWGTGGGTGAGAEAGAASSLSDSPEDESSPIRRDSILFAMVDIWVDGCVQDGWMDG